MTREEKLEEAKRLFKASDKCFRLIYTKDNPTEEEILEVSNDYVSDIDSLHCLANQYFEEYNEILKELNIDCLEFLRDNI